LSAGSSFLRLVRTASRRRAFPLSLGVIAAAVP